MVSPLLETSQPDVQLRDHQNTHEGSRMLSERTMKQVEQVTDTKQGRH